MAKSVVKTIVFKHIRECVDPGVWRVFSENQFPYIPPPQRTAVIKKARDYLRAHGDLPQGAKISGGTIANCSVAFNVTVPKPEEEVMLIPDLTHPI